MAEPKCPVCGRKMKLISYPVKGMFGAKYRCCEWNSPAKMGGTREEAERFARIAALKRKLQKPLTAEEMTSRVFAGHPVYVEEKLDDSFSGYALAEDAEDAANYMMDEYGISFRCWVTRPTEEEIAAAPWMNEQTADEQEGTKAEE